MKNSSPKKSKKILKFIVFMLLVIVLSVLIKINYTDAQRKVFNDYFKQLQKSSKF